jgi:hypothetical protein
MLRPSELKRYAWGSLAAVALIAACSNQREPAQRMMQDIEATVAGASEDAAKYVPGELTGVQMKLDDLKTAYDAQDYKAVLSRGPAILAEAKSLAGDAAAKKAQLARDLTGQWTALSDAVPRLFTAVQARIDLLSQKKNRKLAAGIDLGAAKSGLSDATSEWSKAQGAFGNGNMTEAVSSAKDVKTKLEALAATLKLELPAAAPASAAGAS